MGPRGEPGLPGAMGPPGPQGPNGLSLPGEPVSEPHTTQVQPGKKRLSPRGRWSVMYMTDTCD